MTQNLLAIGNFSDAPMFDHQQLYENPIKNMLYSTFQHVAFVTSLLLNGALVALILKCRKDFGAYRYLLMLFASVDIYYGIVHFLIQPIPETWANAMYMAAHGYITGKVTVCFYATAHSHSYVVLVYHFLYRLLAVKGSVNSRLFSKPWFIGVIFGSLAAVGTSWFLAMYFLYDFDPFVEEYMKPILLRHSISSPQDVHDYVIAVFWTNGTFSGPRWKPIAGLVLMAVTMVACYGFMVYATLEIGREMKRNSAVQSEKTHQMTAQLMRALMYQTFLPVVTAYSPPLIALMFPLLGLSFPYIADISPIFFGVHPLIDGCVLIYTIKEYRTLLISWLHCQPKPSTTSVTRTPTRTLEVTIH